MYDGATVGVVVPAYNERGFVGEVIETVPAFVDHVYVVDDCSTDGTWEEIRETLRALHAPASPRAEPRLTGDGAGSGWRDRIEATVARPDDEGPDRRFVAVRHELNTGVGGAMKTGYRAAVADDVDVVAAMGGDGQMDPDILDRIIHPVVSGDADFSKGNRLRNAEYRDDMSPWRTFGNFLLTYLTRISSGYWRMMDPQNGYTAVSKTALERVELDTLYDDYGFCNHLLVRLNRQGLHIADVSMHAVYGDETSHIRYARFVPTLSLLLLRSYLGRLVDGAGRDGRGAAAAAQLLGIGLGLGGLAVAVGSLVSGSPAGATAAAALLVGGLVLFLAGVVLERRLNAALESAVPAMGSSSVLRLGTETTSPAEDVPGGEE